MIESLQNPRIRQARALQRRRERERAGLLFVEGLRLVEDALAQGVRPQSLFHTAAAWAEPRAAALLAAHPHAATAVSEPVMAALCETVTPQGIAAVVPLPLLPWPERPTLLLVVDGLRDPGNVGTLLRSAAAAGVEGALLPKGTVDPWADKVLRAGMGAHFRLPLRGGLEWAACLPLLQGLTVFLAAADGAPYDGAAWQQPCALIVGGEADGAGQSAAHRADQRLAIPMAAAVESLNAAVAGSILLFEAARQRRSRAP